MSLTAAAFLRVPGLQVRVKLRVRIAEVCDEPEA